MLRESPVPISVGLLGNAAEILPEMVKRGIRPDAVTDQTSAHDPVNGYLPIGWTVEQWIERARARPQGGREGGARLDGGPCRGDARLSRDGRADLRLWQQHPPGRQGRGRHPRLRFPRLRAGLCPAALLPRHRPVPLGGAVGRSGGHLPDRRQGEGADPRRSAPPPLARHGARADRLPGPAGADLLGRPGPAPPARPRLQRDGGVGRTEGAGRDRPRPSRLAARSPAPIARPRR